MSKTSKLTQRVVRHSPPRGPGSSEVRGIDAPDTGSAQHVAACPATRRAARIDVVRNIDPKRRATGASLHSARVGGPVERVLRSLWLGMSRLILPGLGGSSSLRVDHGA